MRTARADAAFETTSSDFTHLVLGVFGGARVHLLLLNPRGISRPRFSQLEGSRPPPVARRVRSCVWLLHDGILARRTINAGALLEWRSTSAAAAAHVEGRHVAQDVLEDGQLRGACRVDNCSCARFP